MPAKLDPLRSTLNIVVSAAIEPQRPCQSNASGVTADVVDASADVAVEGAVFVNAGEMAVVPLAPEPEAKPVAQTAPVASPTAPNASHAVRRRRWALRAGEAGMLDTAGLPFVARATFGRVQ